jgi:hypothetical protein
VYSEKNNLTKKSDRSGPQIMAKGHQLNEGDRKSAVHHDASDSQPITTQYEFENLSKTSQKKDIDAIRHPEEQIIDPKEYQQKDQMSLNDSAKDQRN